MLAYRGRCQTAYSSAGGEAAACKRSSRGMHLNEPPLTAEANTCQPTKGARKGATGRRKGARSRQGQARSCRSSVRIERRPHTGVDTDPRWADGAVSVRLLSRRAAIMAADRATTPASGLRVQACHRADPTSALSRQCPLDRRTNSRIVLRGLFRADNGMSAFAQTSVLPKATRVWALSAEAVRKLSERFRIGPRSENFCDFSSSARR
jgi:hypothetical protein